MVERFDFIGRLQSRAAILAIGPSTLRNQGAPGVVVSARKYLQSVNLDELAIHSRSDFDSWLEQNTDSLMRRFPEGAKENWGAARKALNIFLRDVLYLRPICEHYELSRVESWLELPLDSNSHAGLVTDASELNISRVVAPWPGVRALKKPASDELQAIADMIAPLLETQRVHLDVRYWRKDSIDQLSS